jgi:molybdopterin-synthase adenylyltransferase
LSYSAAFPSDVETAAARHLLRQDKQEDLCFGLWHPSRGETRTTALIADLILPAPGDRQVHGNASFNPQYFERALGEAMAARAGLAFLHSHPEGRGWQGMSDDDVIAERGRAGAAEAATGLPLVGLTLAGVDGSWSARKWEKMAPRTYGHTDFESVRVVGKHLEVSRPRRASPPQNPKLLRTVAAWGPRVQETLSELKVGVVGCGSFGSIVAEALARMGVRRVVLIDFDSVEMVNLDRLLHATELHATRGLAKVHMVAEAIRNSATHPAFEVQALDFSVVEQTGYLAALDCDVLFSCVDRPWPRSVLNLIALAHLIPVIDGGLRLQPAKAGDGLGRGDLKALTVVPGRQCLECVGQFSPEFVAVERDGYLDDPKYIESLPEDHPVRARQNVFGFSLLGAGLEILQLLALFVTPGGLADPGAQGYHFVPGLMDADWSSCKPTCVYAQLVGLGDNAGFTVTGRHAAAEAKREERATLRDV